MSLRTLLGASLLVVGLGGAVASLHMFLWPIVGEERNAPARAGVVLTTGQDTAPALTITLDKTEVERDGVVGVTIVVMPHDDNELLRIIVVNNRRTVGALGPWQLNAKGATVNFELVASVEDGDYTVRVMLKRKGIINDLPAEAPLTVRPKKLDDKPPRERGGARLA